MLGTYAEHLRRLKEQYSAETAELQSTQRPAADRDPAAPPQQTTAASRTSRFQIRNPTQSPPRAAVQQSDLMKESPSMVTPPKQQPHQSSPHYVSVLPQASTFDSERNNLLTLIQGPSSTPTLSTTQLSISNASSAHTQRYREILNEVEQLSNTITALHKERSEIESQWTQRMRNARKDIETKESALMDLEAKYDEVVGELNDCRSQLASCRKDLSKALRDCDMYKHQVINNAELQQQISQLLRDGEEREKLINAQEMCMRELEARSNNSLSTSKEFEMRFLRSQNAHQVELEGCIKREEQLREVTSALGESVVMLIREMEEGCLQLVDGGVVDWTQRSGSQSPQPYRKEEESSVDAVEKNISRIVENIGNGEKTKIREQLYDAVQRQARRLERTIQFVVSQHEEARSNSARSAAESAKLEDVIARTEASAVAAARENSQLRKECQEAYAMIERLRKSEGELAGRVNDLVADAERREASNAKHCESLRQLIEGADLDLHRHRMRVNELEAINTRLASQKALAEEDARSTVQQLRQSVGLKENQISRLKGEIEQLRQRVVAMEDGQHQADETSVRSISAAQTDQSIVGTAFLRQQNQQLAAHIEFLQKRIDRMTTERSDQSAL